MRKLKLVLIAVLIAFVNIGLMNYVLKDVEIASDIAVTQGLAESGMERVKGLQEQSGILETEKQRI